MAVKEQNLYKVWDGENLNTNNIDFLLKRTKPVTFPLDSNTKQIIKDLKDTYIAVPCAGIAANQIGYNARIFVGMEHDHEEALEEDDKQNIDDVKPRSDNMEMYINPKILKNSLASTQLGYEGCLSIPEIQLEVKRFDSIKVSYQNTNGQTIIKKISKFISRLFQHELDHLDGKLMIQRQNEDEVKAILPDENYHNLISKLNTYTSNKI